MHYSPSNRLHVSTVMVDVSPLRRYIATTKNNAFLENTFRVIVKILFRNDTVDEFLKECRLYFEMLTATIENDLHDDMAFLFLYEELEFLFTMKDMMLGLLSRDSLGALPIPDLKRYGFLKAVEPQHIILARYTPVLNVNDIPEKF